MAADGRWPSLSASPDPLTSHFSTGETPLSPSARRFESQRDTKRHLLRQRQRQVDLRSHGAKVDDVLRFDHRSPAPRSIQLKRDPLETARILAAASA